MFLFISLVFALQSQTLWWRMKGCEPAAACNTQMYKEPDQSLYVCDLQFVLTPTCLCEGSAQAAGVNTRHRCSHSSKWRLLHTLWPLPLHPPTASTSELCELCQCVIAVAPSQWTDCKWKEDTCTAVMLSARKLHLRSLRPNRHGTAFHTLNSCHLWLSGINHAAAQTSAASRHLAASAHKIPVTFHHTTKAQMKQGVLRIFVNMYFQSANMLVSDRVFNETLSLFI